MIKGEIRHFSFSSELVGLPPSLPSTRSHLSLHLPLQLFPQIQIVITKIVQNVQSYTNIILIFKLSNKHDLFSNNTLTF